MQFRCRHILQVRIFALELDERPVEHCPRILDVEDWLPAAEEVLVGTASTEVCCALFVDGELDVVLDAIDDHLGVLKPHGQSILMSFRGKLFDVGDGILLGEFDRKATSCFTLITEGI
jgi:hypothetical protein